MSHYFQHDEKRKSVTTKELNRIQAAILRVTKKNVELENDRKILQMQMQDENKKFDLLAALLTKMKKLLEEKKEIRYQVEFDLHKCEMKLERIRGRERDKSEIEKKQKRIEELQAVLNDKIITSKLLQSQIVNLEVKSLVLKIEINYRNYNRSKPN